MRAHGCAVSLLIAKFYRHFSTFKYYSLGALYTVHVHVHVRVTEIVYSLA